MTDTTPTAEVPDNSTGQPVGTLEHLDPGLPDIGLSARRSDPERIIPGGTVADAFATRNVGHGVCRCYQEYWVCKRARFSNSMAEFSS